MKQRYAHTWSAHASKCPAFHHPNTPFSTQSSLLPSLPFHTAAKLHVLPEASVRAPYLNVSPSSNNLFSLHQHHHQSPFDNNTTQHSDTVEAYLQYHFIPPPSPPRAPTTHRYVAPPACNHRTSSQSSPSHPLPHDVSSPAQNPPPIQHPQSLTWQLAEFRILTDLQTPGIPHSSQWSEHRTRSALASTRTAAAMPLLRRLRVGAEAHPAPRAGVELMLQHLTFPRPPTAAQARAAVSAATMATVTRILIPLSVTRPRPASSSTQRTSTLAWPAGPLFTPMPFRP